MSDDGRKLDGAPNKTARVQTRQKPWNKPKLQRFDVAAHTRGSTASGSESGKSSN